MELAIFASFRNTSWRSVIQNSPQANCSESNEKHGRLHAQQHVSIQWSNLPGTAGKDQGSNPCISPYRRMRCSMDSPHHATRCCMVSALESNAKTHCQEEKSSKCLGVAMLRMHFHSWKTARTSNFDQAACNMISIHSRHGCVGIITSRTCSLPLQHLSISLSHSLSLSLFFVALHMVFHMIMSHTSFASCIYTCA